MPMALQGKAKREIFGKTVLCPDFGILSFLENKLLGATKHVRQGSPTWVVSFNSSKDKLGCDLKAFGCMQTTLREHLKWDLETFSITDILTYLPQKEPRAVSLRPVVLWEARSDSGRNVTTWCIYQKVMAQVHNMSQYLSEPRLDINLANCQPVLLVQHFQERVG